MIREEDGKGSLKGPAEITRENKGGTEPSKTPCTVFARTGFTIVSANPKISRLSPFSPTVPQKGLLSRHSLEVFVLFSVYFPFQGRVGIGFYGNSYFSQLILNFIRCWVWQSSSAFWVPGFHNLPNYPTPNHSLLLPSGLITQLVELEKMHMIKTMPWPGRNADEWGDRGISTIHWLL